MPIFLTTGTPGAGKTLFTIDRLKAISDRTIYYHGIKDLALPWVHVDDPKAISQDYPEGSIFVIDECQQHWPVRDHKAPVPEFCKYLETHRHKGHDIYLITQHPKLIDHHIRRLVGEHTHIQRLFGSKRVTQYKADKLMDIDQPFDLKKAEKTVVKHPKSTYALYKSSEVHTVKSRLPKILYILPFLLIPIAYGVYHTFFDLAPTHNKAGGMPAHSEAGQASAVTGSSVPVVLKTKQDWSQALTPVIPSMPYTAPLYSGMVSKPKTMPVLAGCVRNNKTSECKCYTQQATVIHMDQYNCELNVKNTQFNPFKQQQEREHSLAKLKETM